MHYKHEWFSKTLVNASAVKTLAEAAPQWEFSHIGVVKIATGKKYDSCQICHARIMQFIAIRNKKNGVYLLIGADCYDKLLHYLATEKIESVTLRERRQYIAAIKKYTKKNITAAFLAWFKCKKRIPEEIRKTLAVIKKLGYPPSLTAAEELVEYYKTHRRFSLTQLLTRQEQYYLNRYPNLPRLPKTCTLNALPAIQNLIRKWFEEREKERHEEERRKFEAWQRQQEEEERQRQKKLAAERAQGIFLLEELLTVGENQLFHRLIRSYERYDLRPPRLPEKLHKDRISKVRATLVRMERMLPGRIARKEEEWRRKKEEEEQKREEKRQKSVEKATAEIEKKIKSEPEKYLKCEFWRGINPKNKTPQWEFKRNWIKYVLDRNDPHDPTEGPVYVTVTRELVPKKVFLVRKLVLQDLSCWSASYGYAWLL